MHTNNGQRLFSRQSLLSGLKLAGMLLPGIVLDFIYRFHNFLPGLRVMLAKHGITYDGAYDILSSYAGILMTMISLFLTINIQSAERSEKKVYGIPRKELQEEGHARWYILLRNMVWASPLLFLICLNIRCCFTGYFVLVYCYVFLRVHYNRHRNSYKIDGNRKAVVQKLAACLSDRQIGAEQILQYRLLLENIGRSAQEDGNWLEMETLYGQLLKWKDYSEEETYIISYYFSSIIFGKCNKNQAVFIQMLKRYMKETDCEIAQQDGIPDKKWPVLWAMLKFACCEAEEEFLVLFLKWFLDFTKRSGIVIDTTGNRLPQLALNEQAGMLLLLSEYRLRQNRVKSSCLERQMSQICRYGIVTVKKNREYQCMSKIRFLNSIQQEDTEIIEKIITELESDCQNHTRNCIIMNL